MHFSPLFLATGFALLSTCVSALTSPPSTSSPIAQSRLEARSSVSKTCHPASSDFLYQIHADGVSKLGFFAKGSYIRLATNLHAPGFEDSDEIAWNLIHQTGKTFKIQTPDGKKCATSRGKNDKVGLASCKSSKTNFEISCVSCGKTSCGDPYANKCTIRSIDRIAKGQCLSRVGKLIKTEKCNSKDKKQLWGFNLA
ncbi:uncharacterized protein JCM15063_005652 [Sporobolomyces koalae]|uniref:uncharacterized protein n=1 Tax=Sporobolomyces koalae TaxID=500713 RepID=UPI00317962DB